MVTSGKITARKVCENCIDPKVPKVPTVPKVPFSGKAIYQPAGKAAEYAEYACNFYLGCTCNCTYCYNKTGRFKAKFGGNVPTLKKSFKNEEHALEIFEKELQANLPELQKHGLFFTFTSDPMLFETVGLTQSAVEICVQNNIPVKILTKKVDYIVPFLCYSISVKWNNIAFGFTLTGHNEIEPNASTNIERMLAMQKLCNAGFKTFASIEPIIDLGDSLNCIYRVEPVCDLFKIGVLSGKLYNRQELKEFIHNIVDRGKSKYYFKDSLLKAAGINRSELPDNCVTKDYNIFNKQL